ncbi:putative DegT/DnrJ/EryC1/StrS aminotransferase family protein [Bradyrhizobium sp. ORS 278]|uniref:DegT/DnrJ/EryC1/StrS family aminotransferase n=1 Tax=Bradyrhizobium sp. (strain ORS 278) TaxID=114615 RepID=UPI00015089C1|nr:DegT/DnrJ/EryC1/StrS family aminotransferase [Bradyrhizobium sp. ORS 278]CAL78882.1 putative DegT/DnrJ/EryC1/StrS aminotransferase family protein [Bradyrhizobium sp. ORS 278]
MTPIQFALPYFGPEEAAAAAAAVQSGWVVGGPRLRELETAFADHCGVSHGVGVSSWTTGAFLVLKTLGIGPGDEVLVPSLTFIATVNAIVHVGATPVFVDVHPGTYNIDPADIPEKITSRTRAILPVDQLGLPCDIDEISRIASANDLLLIADAACSFGSAFRGVAVGSQATITIFSLHARKIITTGEGGMIVTNDGDFAERLRRQRHQGMSLSDYQRHGQLPTMFETYPEVGYNFRITDVQAAIGVAQLARLPEMLRLRREIAQHYLSRLDGHPDLIMPLVPDHVTPNWQSFQIRLREGARLTRNQLMERLHERGVPTRRGVMASHMEPPYRSHCAILPVTELLARQCLQLPMHPRLTADQIDFIADELTDALK